MKKKIKHKPVTLIVGSSSSISSAIINSISTKQKILLITRKKININNKMIRIIEHDLEKKSLPGDRIWEKLQEDEYIENIIYISSKQVKRAGIETMSDKDIRSIFFVNIINLIIMVKTILKNRPKLPGSIIFFGSQATIFGGNKISTYSASKGAVEVFTKALAKEVGSYGLRVNCLSLGVVRSQTLEAGTFVETEISKTIPLNRIGEPSDVVGVVKWLLSNSSSYITGSIIPVAGGR